MEYYAEPQRGYTRRLWYECSKSAPRLATQAPIETVIGLEKPRNCYIEVI